VKDEFLSFIFFIGNQSSKICSNELIDYILAFILIGIKINKIIILNKLNSNPLPDVADFGYDLYLLAIVKLSVAIALRLLLWLYKNG